MGRNSLSVPKVSEFKVHDRNRFPLKGTNGLYWHYGTILYGVREFMVIHDRMGFRIAIEEVTGGHLEAIQDDNLWEALARFAQAEGLSKI